METVLVEVVFLLVLFPNAIWSVCPQSVPQVCSCEHHPVGLYVKCSHIDTGIEALLSSFGDLPIQRLTVSDTSWKVVDRVPHARVRSLHLTSCGISKIEKNAFNEMAEELEELVLSNNSLTSLPVLGSLPRLLSLNLNNNKLTDIEKGTLEGVGNLKHLRVEGNNICAPSRDSLSEVKGTLELLDMSDNCLTLIPASVLRNSLRLMYLDLSHNQISVMQEFDLINLPLLKELRMNDNVIASVSPKTLMNVPHLQYLYLKNNSIQSIEKSVFGTLKQLEVLDVSHNGLSEIPTTNALSNIRQIRLDSNRISHIGARSISGNARLQLLNLQNNAIKTISRDGFHALDQLSILNLGNNSIRTLESQVLEGMPELQQMNLRNNSLIKLSSATFLTLPLLTTLDLAHNALRSIHPSALNHLKKLFWLDLSSNRLSSLRKDTFKHRIPNILLYGNRFDCDSGLDWLSEYLALHQVRTALPHQPDVTCTSPEKYAGVALKELMNTKLDEAVNSQSQTNTAGHDVLSSLLPSEMRGLFSSLQIQPHQNPLDAVPVISALSDSVSSLRFAPETDSKRKVKGEGAKEVVQLNDALEQFSAPLIRLSTGGRPLPSDFEQMIRSIPRLLASPPGMENIDVNKLPPEVITHVLRGGQIPGIANEKLEEMVKGFVKQMYTAAEAANKGQPLADESRYLPPLKKLPREIVTGFINGRTIPYLDEKQMAVIMKYYTARLPLAIAGDNGSSENVMSTKLGLPPELVEIVKLLPPGYDISKIPKEVMESVGRGEIPNLSMLPADLQQYLVDNSQRLMASFANKPDVTLDDILNNLPHFDRPMRPTFSPYELGKLDGNLVSERNDERNRNRVYCYAAILLGLVAAVSLTMTSIVCIHMRRKRLLAMSDRDMIVRQWQLPPPRASSSPKQPSHVSFVDEETSPSRRGVSRLSGSYCQ